MEVEAAPAAPVHQVRARLQRALGRRWASLSSFFVRRRLAECGPHLFMDRGVDLHNPRRMHFGDSVVLRRGAVLSCSSGGDLRLAKQVYVGIGTIIACGDALLRIGPRTGIGAYVSIRNADHGAVAGRLFSDQEPVAAPIVIGEGVFIGDRAAIMRGVTVGDGAVIAPNSLVLRDVPPNAVVAGVPARVVDSRQ